MLRLLRSVCIGAVVAAAVFWATYSALFQVWAPTQEDAQAGGTPAQVLSVIPAFWWGVRAGGLGGIVATVVAYRWKHRSLKVSG